jgi:hypothetical protein
VKLSLYGSNVKQKKWPRPSRLPEISLEMKTTLGTSTI